MGAETILVVEDDPEIAGEVVRGLRDRGFTVELATDGDAASVAVAGGAFALIILDIMLPKKSGFELLDEWASRMSTPIIVLTARTDLDDRLRAFDKGAVDFLPKPFWVEELAARIESRLGRPPAPTKRISFRGCTVDLDARSAFDVGGDLSLTPHEFNLLAHLVTRPGRAISRRQLAEHALRANEDVSDRTVDTHVARLRKKLGNAGEAIATVWGVGYRFQ